MIIQIKIPDNVYEQYRAYRPSDPELAIAQQVIRFAEVSPTHRILLVPSKEREEIEQKLGTQFSNAKELLKKISEVLTLKIEGESVSVTPETLFRLREQAEFEGLTPEEFMKTKLAEGVRIAAFGW